MDILSEGVEMFHNACASIVIHQDVAALNWCANYDIAGSKMNDPHACYIQALYVESNIDTWQGDVADATRELLGKAISRLKEERLI